MGLSRVCSFSCWSWLRCLWLFLWIVLGVLLVGGVWGHGWNPLLCLWVWSWFYSRMSAAVFVPLDSHGCVPRGCVPCGCVRGCRWARLRHQLAAAASVSWGGEAKPAQQCPPPGSRGRYSHSWWAPTTPSHHCLSQAGVHPFVQTDRPSLLQS